MTSGALVGVARGEIDQRDSRNAGIVNIDKVARNARGLVEYETFTVESYVRQVAAVAAELVAARLLLPEDAERYVATARAARPF